MPRLVAAGTTCLMDSSYLMLQAGHGLLWPWDCSADPTGERALA